MQPAYLQQEPAKPAHPATGNNVYMMQTREPGLSGSTVNLVSESTAEPYTALYVVSILATIFCTLPCSFIGLAHIIAARADYSRGSLNLARKKRNQALCWTAWACGIGGFFFLIAVILVAVLASAASGFVSTANQVNMYVPQTTTTESYWY